jgi:hypothetical protein
MVILRHRRAAELVEANSRQRRPHPMAPSAETGSGKHVARNLVLALRAFLALFWAVVLFATWGNQFALFGWNLGPDVTSLIYV